jgi:hypothetical protein
VYFGASRPPGGAAVHAERLFVDCAAQAVEVANLDSEELGQRRIKFKLPYLSITARATEPRSLSAAY